MAFSTGEIDTSALARTVMERCDTLSRFTEEPGQLTRTFLSPPMRDVHRVIGGWMEACGMTVRVDAVGNLVGRYPAAREDAPILLLGSHLDTVPNGGKYDGQLGVLLALALVEALGGTRLPFAIDVLGFSEEEGVRFRTPYLGSRAVSGTFDGTLLELRDANGITVGDSIRAFGLDPGAILGAAYTPHNVLGYVEAHIEQGPVLEERGLAVGVVQAIAGQSRLRLRFLGQAAHAGTTPMGALRRDALTGAAAFIGAVESYAGAVDGLVATVGSVSVEPNAGNVIPGVVEISLDVRHAENAVRENAVSALLHQAETIARERSLGFAVVQRHDFAAVPMDARMTELLSHAVTQEGITPLELVSGAGHDAAIMAPLFPSTMLFLRTPNHGLSHHPNEAVAVEDVEVALRVLLRFLEDLNDTYTKKERS